jgi:hypothetical protein
VNFEIQSKIKKLEFEILVCLQALNFVMDLGSRKWGENP